MALEQKQQQKQSVALLPQMIQSMSILQMGIQELREYTEEILQENPTLEFPEEAAEPAAPYADAVRRLEWLEANDCQNAYYHRQDEERDDGLANLGRYSDEENDLSWYILSQFMMGDVFEPEVLRAIEFLVERLDANGFLDGDAAFLAATAHMDEAVMERAIIELQSADPAGVGARDLSECLRLQLEHRSGDHSLAVAIVENHLDELARSRYGVIAKTLGVSKEEARRACDLIRTLNPRPGTGFAAQENLAYIIPDLEIVVTPDGMEISVNDTAIPRLVISDYYRKLLRDTNDPNVQKYLSQKLGQAKWVIQGIGQRRTTLLRCAQFLAQRQEEFFRLGAGHLRPLTMRQAAQALNVHESTVSRTVKNKYLRCPQGVYPLGYFFAGAVGESGASAESAKALLLRLVAEEKKPLSDQKLCEEMERRGCSISRRTVTKYREELHIPSAADRRRK